MKIGPLEFLYLKEPEKELGTCVKCGCIFDAARVTEHVNWHNRIVDLEKKADEPCHSNPIK